MANEDLTRIGMSPTTAPVNRCLEVDDGDGERRLVPLGGERMLIGRLAEAPIQLHSKGTSRRHAELFSDPFGRWWIRDLGSSNGTLVNGFRIDERMLELDDQIQIGDAQLVVTTPSARLSEAPAVAADAMPVREAKRDGHISTLTRGEEPKISAQHLTTLMGLNRRLASIDTVGERLRQLCSLMVSKQFGGRAAVVLRLDRKDAGKSPQPLCKPQAAADWDTDALFVTKGLLQRLRQRPEAMLSDEGDSGASGADIASVPETAAMSAMACPLRTAPDEVDVLYVMMPPTHGTMEWLTLTSLAAEQFRQTEINWAARRQARVSAMLEQDLQRGHDIQMRLIPKKIDVAGLDATLSFKPCRWVAGDYVDVVKDLKSGKTLLVVADVCGKGLPAALISASLHTMVHTCMRAGASLLGMVTLMNEHLYEHLPANRFVTGIFMAIDGQSGAVEFINAGHPAPLVLGPDGGRRYFDMGDYEPLGLTKTKYTYLTDRLEPGELLAMFTDGLTELRDQQGKMLTSERLADHMHTIFMEDPKALVMDIAAKLNKVLDEHQGDRLQVDDRTFLLARKR
jgi:serine phosphatase RsbU (regulator of sigma subunit)